MCGSTLPCLGVFLSLEELRIDDSFSPTLLRVRDELLAHAKKRTSHLWRSRLAAKGEDADSSEAESEAERVSALFGEHFRLVLAVTGQWARKLETPSEPGRLADYVASQIELPAVAKQGLLETLSVPDRLREEVEMLGDSIRKLTERWEERREQKFTGAALN